MVCSGERGLRIVTDLEGNLIRKDRLDEVRYGKTGKPELLAESAMQFWFSFGQFILSDCSIALHLLIRLADAIDWASLEKAYKNVEKPNDGTTKQGKELHHE